MWYELDVNDRLVAVSNDWDALSASANVPGNRFEAIRYLPIWEFVVGEETQRFLRAMFFLARNKRRDITLPYQLDGMGENSHFRMRIEPLQQGGLLVAHDPERRNASPPQLVSYAANDLTRCSQCLRIGVDGVWYTAEPMIDPASHSQSQWCVCCHCKENALKLVKDMHEPAVASYARAGFSKY